MQTLYRVFPHLPAAAEDEPGGGLFMPPQGGGRIDNPDAYSVLYLSDAAAGAIAEAFGRFPEWTASMLEGSPSLPGSIRSLGRYRLTGDARVCDLDDPKQLVRLALRPSDVVSRDYERTRRWARGIYNQRNSAGVRWWSYYDPKWASIGLWRTDHIALEEVTPLTLDAPALLEASHTIIRRVTRQAMS